MSKVRNLEIIPYRLPLKGALAWGKFSSMNVAEHVLIKVTLENGVWGLAEAPPRPTIYGETVSSMRGMLEFLKPRLYELEIDDINGIKTVLSSVPNNNVVKGALDMALWDARVKSKGSDLFSALAGSNSRIAVSYILGISDTNTMLEEARRVIDAGVRVLKVKVGRNYAKDLEVIAQLQTEFSSSRVRLYADSNETLEPATAPKILEAMRNAGLMYVEEPLPVRQTKARAMLRKLKILPIIADDSCFTKADLERELDFDTFDILNIKTARNGFTESLEMIELATQAGKGIMIGSQASTTLGTIHAAIISSRLEVNHPCELSFFLKLESEIVNQIPKLEDGILKLETLKGIEIDPEKLKVHSIR
jgi:L-alanine-DL-glutamate epimerase-like enolase superfamily enzyme